MIYTYCFQWRCEKCEATGKAPDQLTAFSIASQHQQGCNGTVEISPEIVSAEPEPEEEIK